MFSSVTVCPTASLRFVVSERFDFKHRLQLLMSAGETHLNRLSEFLIGSRDDETRQAAFHISHVIGTLLSVYRAKSFFMGCLCFTHHSVYLLSQLFQEDGDPPVNESLSIENTLWASTVVASGKYVTVGAALWITRLIPRK